MIPIFWPWDFGFDPGFNKFLTILCYTAIVEFFVWEAWIVFTSDDSVEERKNRRILSNEKNNTD